MCYTEMQRLATRNNVRIKSENSHLDYGVERVFIERGDDKKGSPDKVGGSLYLSLLKIMVSLHILG